MNFKPIHDISGTALQGEITETYANLVNVFGHPHHDGDGYKTDAEWDLKFDDGTIATIYNWKNGVNYLYNEGLQVEDITEWHIGGTNKRAVDLVVKALQDYDVIEGEFSVVSEQKQLTHDE